MLKLNSPQIYLLLSIFFQASTISTSLGEQLIVWNVGQGQWVTLKLNDSCHHIDMGGEFAPLQQIISLCKGLKNTVYFSHADLDHINFYKKFSRSVNDICIENKPVLLKQKLKIKKLSLCKKKASNRIKTIYKNRSKNYKNLNELSSVFLLNNFFLIPGDSTTLNEKTWKNKTAIKNTQVLLLGHHGSLTSTSNELLKKMPRLLWSISSSRKERYGHPHGLITIRLKANKTPIISTQNWGSLFIEL